MAAQPLQWVFSIFDKMSGPAKAIAGSLGKVEGALGKAGAALNRFSESTKHTRDAVEKGLVAFGGLTAGAAALAYGLLGVAKQAAAIQKVDRVLGSLLGESEAQTLAKYLNGIASSTQLARGTLDDLAITLARAGLKGEGLRRALLASLDADALGGNAAEVAEGFAMIAQTGMFSTGQIKSMGLVADEVYAQIGKVAGVSAKNVEKAITAGVIKPAQIMAGIEASLAAKGGGHLGDASARESKSLSSMLAKLEGLPGDVLMKLDLGPFADAMSRALGQIMGLFDETTGTGGRVVAALQAILDTFGAVVGFVSDHYVIFGALAFVLGTVVTALALTEGALLAVAAATAILNAVMALNPFVLLAVAIVGIVALLYVFWDDVVDVFDGIGQAIEDAFAWFGNLGSKGLAWAGNLIDGLIDGIKNGAKWVWDAIKGLAGGIVNSFKGMLGIASPSKVFREFGRFSGLGYIDGLKAIDGEVDKAVTRTVKLDGVESAVASAPRTMKIDSVEGVKATVASGGGMGGSRSLTVEIGGVHVNAAGTSDPKALAQQVAAILPSLLAPAIEQLAVESGVL